MNLGSPDLTLWIKDQLFDTVPMSIAVIDRNFNLVAANHAFKEFFGDWEGRKCHAVYKSRDSICPHCNASEAFLDGKSRVGEEIGFARDGQPTYYVKHTIPIKDPQGNVSFLIEMSIDVTENRHLQNELSIAHTFLDTLIATSHDGIVGLDEKGQVTVFNQAARRVFGVAEGRKVSDSELFDMLPEGFIDQVKAGDGTVVLPESVIHPVKGEDVPVRLIGMRLKFRDQVLGMAFTIQNLTRIKQLEAASLESERLAAVGQTVAGLAHGIKNLVAGLDGGMYMLNTGIEFGESDRIVQGWDILDRNIKRIGMFVKAFLSFSKGREIQVREADPAEVAEEVVALYSVNAERSGIELKYEPIGRIQPAPLDSEGLHECLTNLVGNAIDACQMSEHDKVCRVTLRVFEKDEAVIYEVIDNGCGMDYEIKRKVFTTFFTSKGLGGTGLGLLTTRKIVQEHGGRIEVESEPGLGSTFRVILPRDRLSKLSKDLQPEPST